MQTIASNVKVKVGIGKLLNFKTSRFDRSEL